MPNIYLLHNCMFNVTIASWINQCWVTIWSKVGVFWGHLMYSKHPAKPLTGWLHKVRHYSFPKRYYMTLYLKGLQKRVCSLECKICWTPQVTLQNSRTVSFLPMISVNKQNKNKECVIVFAYLESNRCIILLIFLINQMIDDI